MSNRLVPEFDKVANSDNRICYVCGVSIPADIPNQYFCHRYYDLRDESSQTYSQVLQFRHLWHGVPGIRSAVGGGGGFNGYALTLEEARQRAVYYVDNNPYAAPEVQGAELSVLMAVNWHESKQSPRGICKCEICKSGE